MNLPTLFFPLAALALWPFLASGSRRAVGWSLVGLFFILLGASAATAAPSTVQGGFDPFLAGNAGLIWCGLGHAAYGAWAATRAGDPFTLKRYGSVAANIGITLVALIAAWAMYSVWPLLYAGRWGGIVVALGLGASALILSLVLPKLKFGAAVRWLDDRWLVRSHLPDPHAGSHGRHAAWYVILGAVLAVILSHRLLPAILEGVAALAGVYLVGRRTGRTPRLPVQGIVAALSLLVFLWGVWTIAGPDIPLHFPDILQTPFSDAAEATLALVLGLGVWVMLGLWPWHGAGPGSTAALVGGAFLIRWGVGLIPDGIVHAAAIYALVAGVAAIHAAATGRVGEYIAALGVLAVIGGGAGAWALFALSSVIAGLRVVEFALPIPGLDRRQLGGIALVPVLAWGLPTMLTGETFMTVLALLCGVGLFRPIAD